MFNNYASLAEGIVLFSSILCRTIPRKTHNAFTEEQVPGQPAVHVGSSNPLRDAVQDRSQSWKSVDVFSAPHLGVHFHVQDWSRIGGFQLGKWGYQKSIDGFCDGKSHYNGWFGGTPRKPPIHQQGKHPLPGSVRGITPAMKKKIRYLVANYPRIVSGLQPWL